MHKWLCWVLLLVGIGLSLKTEAHAIETVPCQAIFFTTPSDSLSAHPSDSLQPRKHKLIAAVLAFPLTGGVLGLHRLYLGSSHAMPLVYVATLGGGFGILPFVDFVLILLNKDVNCYAHSTRLFMWTHKPTSAIKQ